MYVITVKQKKKIRKKGKTKQNLLETPMDSIEQSLGSLDLHKD